MIIKCWVKRIFSILLATFLLTGCRASQEISDNLENTENRLSGTIVFWQSFPQRYFTDSLMSQYQEVFAEEIGNFTELYPEVKIITEFKEEKHLVEELERELEKGLGPDLIYAQFNYILPLIKAKALLPLDKDSIDLLEFRFEALDQFFYQEKMYGVPIDLTTQVLCYNKTKVKEIPETLSELINQARKGYSVGMLSSFEDTFWGTQIFGGQLLDAQGRVILRPRMGVG